MPHNMPGRGDRAKKNKESKKKRDQRKKRRPVSSGY